MLLPLTFLSLVQDCLDRLLNLCFLSLLYIYAKSFTPSPPVQASFPTYVPFRSPVTACPPEQQCKICTSCPKRVFILFNPWDSYPINSASCSSLSTWEMSPALPAGPKQGRAATKAPPGKGACAPKPGTQLGTPRSPQAPFWIPSTPCTCTYRKKETQPQDFGGLRYRQALKTYSKMIIHKNIMVFMSSLIALQGGVKHSPRAGQLTGGNATPWLCLGQVYTCAWHNANQSLSFIIVMSHTVNGRINSVPTNSDNKAGII